MRVERKQSAGEPRTLTEAYAITPMVPPANASPADRAAFHRSRAEMFEKVAQADPSHKHEAMANVWLERENANTAS